MNVLEWPNRKARIWRGELPPVCCTTGAVLRADIPVPPVASHSPRQAAIELSVHLGPRFQYGLLGAEYTPGGHDTLSIVVATSAPASPVYEGALYAGGGVTRNGIHPEYGPAILSECSTPGGQWTLGPGILRFQIGAHNDVASSQAAFARLTRMLLQLLQPDTDTLCTDGLRELVASVWRQQGAQI